MTNFRINFKIRNYVCIKSYRIT